MYNCFQKISENFRNIFLGITKEIAQKKEKQKSVASTQTPSESKQPESKPNEGACCYCLYSVFVCHAWCYDT